MKEVYFTQRAIAYFIDVIIVTIISSLCLLVVSAIKPQDDKYQKASEEFLTKYEEILQKPDAKEMTKFFDEQKDNMYLIERSGVIGTVFDIIILAGYFGAFQFFNGGQTLGKKVAKIKVVGNDNKKDYNYGSSLLRTSLNYGLFSKVLLIILVLVLNANNYMIPVFAVQSLAMLFNLILIIMVAFRKDGRSLSDMICNTKVISSK